MIILSKIWGDEADPDALLKIYTFDVVLLYSLSANLELMTWLWKYKQDTIEVISAVLLFMVIN